MWSIFQAIKRSWSQHFVEQFTGFIILLTSYSALVFITLSLVNVQKLFDVWGQVNQVSVYFSPDIQETEKKKVLNFLDDSQMVRSLHQVSSEQAANEFGRRFTQLSKESVSVKNIAKFFPGYVILDLDQTQAYKSGAGALESFVDSVQAFSPSIARVSYGKNWLSQYVSFLEAFEFGAYLLILTFLLASVVISSSIIKSILYARKEEIEIMEFIGADDKAIYFPHIINIIGVSAVSLLGAYAINYGIYSQLVASHGVFSLSDSRYSLEFLGFLPMFSLFALILTAVFFYSVFTIYGLLPRHKKALFIKEVKI